MKAYLAGLGYTMAMYLTLNQFLLYGIITLVGAIIITVIPKKLKSKPAHI